MKKFWIWIAAITGALLCGLLVLLLLTTGKFVDSGDAESLYPYELRVKGKLLTVRISGDLPENTHWAAASDNTGAADVTGLRAKRRHTDVQVKGAAGGSANVTMTLLTDEALPETLYTIAGTVVADAKGRLTVMRIGHAEPQPAVEGGNDKFTYRITQSGDGALIVRLTDKAGGAWTVSGGGMVWAAEAPSDENAPEAGTVFILTPQKTGRGEARCINGDAGATLVLHLLNGEDGFVRLLSAEPLDTAEQLTEDPRSGEAVYEATYGTVPLRLSSVLGDGVTFMARLTSRADGITAVPVGCTEYRLGVLWRMYTSDAALEEDLVGTGAPDETVSQSGMTAKLYSGDFGVRTVWQYNGTYYMLECEDASADDARALTAQVLAAIAE